MRKTALIVAAGGFLTSSVATQSTTFGAQQVIEATGSYARCAAHADIDLDGDIDVISSYAGGIYLNLNDGSGTFAPAIPVAAAFNSHSLHAADLDGDGDADILAANQNDDEVAFFVNLGGGVFSAPFVVTSTADGATSVVASDLDGDGDLDILIASTNDDRIAWHENFGFGFFGSKQIISTSPNGPVTVRAADIDGDGDNDVVANAIHSSRVYWWSNMGGGSFSQQQSWSSLGSPSALLATDFDDDGDVDLFFNGNETLYLAENLGGGIFAPIASVGGWSRYWLDAGDFDGDGDIDLVGASGSGNLISWMENDSNGSFVWHSGDPITNVDAQEVHVADLDGDGDVDIFAPLGNDSTVAWYTNHSLPISAVPFGSGCGSPAMSFEPTIAAVIARSMEGAVNDTPTPVCVVSLGFSNTNMPGLGVLPLDLSAVGMTGCTLYQSAEIFGLGTTFSGQPFRMDFAFPLPNNNLLVGARIYTQAFSLAPGVNSLEVIGSNGIDWLIGN